MTYHSPDPLDRANARDAAQERGAEPPTALDLFLAGDLNWEAFVELDAIERELHGRPPVPSLTRGQEIHMWLRLGEKLATAEDGE